MWSDMLKDLKKIRKCASSPVLWSDIANNTKGNIEAFYAAVDITHYVHFRLRWRSDLGKTK